MLAATGGAVLNFQRCERSSVLQPIYKIERRRHKTMAETTFYSMGSCVVTNARAVMANKTYALANVTSVRKEKIPVDYHGAALLIVVGLMVMTIFNSMIFGVLLMAGGIAWAVIIRPKYAVKLGSASGEMSGLVSKDQAEIDRIVEAVSEAIIHRG
jgi:hypothetical protein